MKYEKNEGACAEARAKYPNNRRMEVKIVRHHTCSKKTHYRECTVSTKLSQHPIDREWNFWLTYEYPKNIRKQYDSCCAYPQEFCLVVLLKIQHDQLINKLPRKDYKRTQVISLPVDQQKMEIEQHQQLLKKHMWTTPHPSKD